MPRLNETATAWKAEMQKKYGTAFTDTLTDYQVACILTHIAEGVADENEALGEELDRFHRD